MVINQIKNKISWEKLPAEKRADYVINIVRAIAKEGYRCAEIFLSLNFVVPFNDIELIKKMILESLPGAESVRLKFCYEQLVLNDNQILSLYMPYMKDVLRSDYAALSKTISEDDFEYKNGNLVIYALGERTVELLNQKAAPSFSGMITHDFGIKVNVLFMNKPDLYEEKTSKFEEHSLEEIRILTRESEKIGKANAAANAERASYSEQHYQNGFGLNVNGGSEKIFTPKKRKTRAYEGKIVGNRLLGKAIVGDTVNIGKVMSNQDKKWNLIGMVFKKEIVPLRNGTKKMMFYFTDFTDSMCVVTFVSEKKADELEENIKTGDYIKICGSIEFDKFENNYVFSAESIEKAEKPDGRKDTCERKRIELHAHTKMSKTDGFNDIEKFIDTAAGWGHKAVAITDHGVILAFPIAAHHAEKLNIKILYGVEGYLVNEGKNSTPDKIDYKSNRSHHVIIMVRTQTGMKNMYKLISKSHIDYFYKTPRMPKTVIQSLRDGLIIGSACQDGEVYQAILKNKSEEEIEEIISFYDYLEIQPRLNNMFLVRDGVLPDEEAVLDINRRILEYGKKLGKPVVATCDTHYTNPEDSIYRKIIMAGHGIKGLETEPALYFRTTDEMLEEFSYLGKEDAEYVVIDAPEQIAEMIEDVKVVPDDRYPPDIPGCENRLRDNCYTKASEIYGDPLPELVKTRLDKELESVIGNGYAVMYVAAEMLVQKSLSDGYLVGSRGSVGSSFAATMGGITEVNPLPPHYICPNCKHFELDTSGDYDCGVDMPDKLCPICNTPYQKDGFNIPFEVFLGFEGDKEPDIDLNFAGEYQPVAHKYVEEIFGSENVFRAGTITAIQEKTAMGYVRKYYEERGESVNKYEMIRLASGCNGVRKSTGQHPGGMVIVPKGHEIYEFCPVQNPADGRKDIITTHFEYHSIDKNLLKLDILGHDVPSMIRMLQDFTGVAPEDVPLRDDKVNSIFLGIDGLDIKEPDYMFKHGTFGIPEFGTQFTRQMLDDTKPSTFADLVRIAGFSHGTDVWLNNAQTLIVSGQCTTKEAISTRDDIMNYLIKMGVPANASFKIMESVRKGKGVKPEWEELMKEHDVPDWYIGSCKKIQYMFPKAHAVAYVMMSYRIAYFKVYYPLAFYAVCFSRNVDAFNIKTMLAGKDVVKNRIILINEKGKDAQEKESKELTVLEIVYEMLCRGYEFENVNLELSDAVNFLIHDGKILVPFNALDGMGEVASRSLADAVKEGPFLSIEDLQYRSKINKKSIEALYESGVLDGMPASDQMSLF